MTTSEKVAYLKGLAEGMCVEDAGQGKLFKVIIDILEDLSLDLADTKDALTDLTDAVEDISDDLAVLEEEVYENLEAFFSEDEDEEDDGEEDEDELGEDDEEEDEDTFYSVKCPGCGAVLTVDGDILDEGEFECPECGEVIDFDTAEVEEVEFDDEEDEEE